MAELHTLSLRGSLATLKRKISAACTLNLVLSVIIQSSVRVEKKIRQ